VHHNVIREWLKCVNITRRPNRAGWFNDQWAEPYAAYLSHLLSLPTTRRMFGDD